MFLKVVWTGEKSNYSTKSSLPSWSWAAQMAAKVYLTRFPQFRINIYFRHISLIFTLRKFSSILPQFTIKKEKLSKMRILALFSILGMLVWNFESSS